MYEIVLAQGGNVPGGHWCIKDGPKKPFITPMTECNSVALKHTDRVVDVGAYVGTYAIRCARFPVCRVDAYEPAAYSRKILQRTRLPNLYVHSAAVMGHDRPQTRFWLSAGIGVTNSSTPKRNPAAIHMVPSVNFATAVKGATVVKIDIEGAEYGISYSDLCHDSLRAIIIDFHPIGKYWKDKAEGIVQHLERCGFEAIIRPKWNNGWTRAGSWVREPLSAPTQVCVELMTGSQCCGCGMPLTGMMQKAICAGCQPHWSKRHRDGYQLEDQ